MLGKKSFTPLEKNFLTGFTLVEVLIVVVIIGILAAIVAPAVLGRRKEAYGTEGVSALGSIRMAERVYYSQYERYADNLADLELVASNLGGRFYGGTEERIHFYVPAGGQSFIVKIDGINEAQGEWVEIDDKGLIRQSYKGHSSLIP